MGESTSARTQRELADLRGAIDRDVDALRARVRSDADPRNLLRRQPMAVAGSLASVAAAAALGIMRRAREAKRTEGILDALMERFGGRIDKMKGKARKEFRKQLAKELAKVERTGPREAAYGAVSAAIAALAATMGQGFGRKLLGDETEERP
ncbi:MAG: hypothetical protein HYU87_09360 [Chloroflexi bacterium]|nr:hypothetical protein [Chloroflexota bacterium]